jgi:predicted NBD/HSP70 family sugar kinase
LQPLPEDFIFVHIGRGVGAGIIRKGEIYTGAHMRAGEFGHISVDWQGPKCSCGNRGCLEKYISLNRIAEGGKQLGFATLEELAEAYRQGDKIAVALMENKAQLLAVGISNMLTMQPVKHIVIGGAICRFGDDFLWAVRDAVQALGFRKYMNLLTVTYTKNPAGNGALGAFWNYMDHELTFEKEGFTDV